MKTLLFVFIQIPASAREGDVEHMKGKGALRRIPDELLEDHLALRADDLEFIAQLEQQTIDDIPIQEQLHLEQILIAPLKLTTLDQAIVIGRDDG